MIEDSKKARHSIQAKIDSDSEELCGMGWFGGGVLLHRRAASVWKEWKGGVGIKANHVQASTAPDTPG